MNDQELMQQALEALNHVNVQDRVQIITALRERLAQPEQEPFCYHDGRNIVGKEYADHSDVFPLYTAPPQNEWQGLTAEEYETMAEDYVTNCYFNTLKYARAIEAKLKERNS